jgi:hypothetical protein
MIRNLSALAADLAGYTSGVLRARATYRAEHSGYGTCKRGHTRRKGEDCNQCAAEAQRRYRRRKEAES